VLVLAPVLLLIGCEVGVGPITGSPLAAVWTIPDTGITLSPPGTMVPIVSADRAYDLCRTHVAECDPGAPTAVQLALMTDTGSNMVANDTLVWVFSWLGSDGCSSSGGGNPAPNTPAVPPKPICANSSSSMLARPRSISPTKNGTSRKPNGRQDRCVDRVSPP
jgi:hypothetical protein